MARPADQSKQKLPAQASNEEENKSNCKRCQKDVLDDQKALGCEICEYWFHIECEGYPEAVYDFMVNQKQGQQLNWSCSFCHHGCNMLQKRIKKIEDQQLKLEKAQQQLELTTSKLLVNVDENKVKSQDMEVRLGHLEAKSLQTNEAVDKCTTVTNNIVERLGIVEAKLMDNTIGVNAMDTKDITDKNNEVKKELDGRLGSLEMRFVGLEEKVTARPDQPIYPTVKQDSVRQYMNQEEMYREICDMRSKENNLVIYGSLESSSGDIMTRIEHDRSIVKDLLVSCNLAHEQSKILRVTRLGRPGQDRDKPRPMLVKLSDTTVKRNIFGNIKLLQGNKAFENVRIKHDLTRREQQQESAMWNEAKNLFAEGKGKHIVVGPPWRRRIVKVKEQNRQTDSRSEVEETGHQGAQEGVGPQHH